MGLVPKPSKTVGPAPASALQGTQCSRQEARPVYRGSSRVNSPRRAFADGGNPGSVGERRKSPPGRLADQVVFVNDWQLVARPTQE